MSDMELLNRLNNCTAINSYLAEVVSVNDPENMSRVQIKLLSFNNVTDQDAAIWARVSVPFAGDNRGAFLIPDVGDEVLVTFVNGDTRFPVVTGSLWNGSTNVPEQLGGDGESVDRWAIKGKEGTRVAIEEESAGNAKILFTTPGNVSGELTDSGGGKVEFKMGGTTLTIDSQGVTINTSLNLTVQASMVSISASMVTVDAGISKFSGVVQADTVIANSVISASYTPGAGNIW
ncbi:VgrG protein [hydrothermal vent metagenome]|uniref:VgrG protein n=1 Tax=hydrothermal vent metagenome TaxID=652676 RepID=A0A3B0Y400_9ZZZZ